MNYHIPMVLNMTNSKMGHRLVKRRKIPVTYPIMANPRNLSKSSPVLATKIAPINIGITITTTMVFDKSNIIAIAEEIIVNETIP